MSTSNVLNRPVARSNGRYEAFQLVSLGDGHGGVDHRVVIEDGTQTGPIALTQ